MLTARSIRPLDAAIAVLAVLVLAIGGYLGYSVWSHRQETISAAPASRAVDDLVARVRKDPNNLNLRMELAQSLAVAGRDGEALKQYEAILGVNKTHAPALAGIGFLAMKKQDWKTGEDYFRKVVSLIEGIENANESDQLETAYFYLGTALYERKEYEEAAQNFTNALRIRRDASDTHYALAVTFRELGNERKYRESLENALLFDPTMAEPNYDLGMILLKQGDVAPAAEHFRTSADAAPKADKPREALEKLGTAEARLAAAKKLESTDIKKALVEARIAAALDPKSPDALMYLGTLYEKDRNKDQALKAYQKVLSIDPLSADAKAAVKRLDR